jgi:hypothetical protein
MLTLRWTQTGKPGGSDRPAFAKRAGEAPFPVAEVIATRPVRYLVLGLVILLAIGFLALGVSVLNGDCSAGLRTCATTGTGTGRR